MPNTGVQVTATRRSRHTQIHARLRVPSVLASLGVSFGSLITRAILAATPPHINLRPGGLPGDRAAGHGSRESIRTKATRQGWPLRFTQAWLVACCTTTSPALRWTSPSNIATALPDESSLVTTRRTSGGLCCCAAADPANATAALMAAKDDAIFMVLLL